MRIGQNGLGQTVDMDTGARVNPDGTPDIPAVNPDQGQPSGSGATPGTPGFSGVPTNPSTGTPDYSRPTPSGPGSPNSAPGGTDPYSSQFSNEAYFNTPGFQALMKGFVDQRTAPTDARNWTPQQVSDQVKGYAQTFHDEFVNKVGAEPTAQDYSTFFQSYLTPSKPWMQQIPPGQYQSDVSGSIANLFSGEAQDVATKKAKDLATQETAGGSPFDVWQQGYKKSISDTESQLQDFQSRLFEKIRPNLITSLKAQGLLDSGALNEAMAGTAGDLTAGAENYMAGVRTNAAQDINNRKFAINQAPNDFATANLFSTPGNISANGQNALTNLFNQEAQMNSINATRNSGGGDSPSQIARIGGGIAGETASNFLDPSNWAAIAKVFK